MDERYIKLMKRQNALLAAILIVVVGFVGLVVVTGCIYLPKIDQLMVETQAMVKEIDKVAVQIGELSTEVQNSNLTDTIDSFNSIDIDSLNTAIQDLKKVVEPLAKLFGK